MAVICSFCGTENRAVARFCIDCVGPLSPDFEPTQVMSRHAQADHTTPASLPTAFADFAAAPPSKAPRPAATARKTAGAEPKRGLWLSVAAFAITLAIAAGGWMIAGAGGWYIYSAAKVAPDTAPKELTAIAPPAAEPAAPLIPVADVADVAAPASQPINAAPQALEPASPPSQLPLPAAQSPLPMPTTTVQAVPAPPAAQPLPESPAARATRGIPPRPAAAMTRDAARTANPLAQCAGLGFLARSRCAAAQCAKAEHRAKSACEPVLAQQRLMEEKRNPLMAN